MVGLTTFAATARAQTVHVTDDSYINFAIPAQVNGAATSLLVRSGIGGDRQTFLQFDLSTLPANVPASKATLRLFVSAVNNPGPVDVHAILDPWAEETLSASGAPPLGSLVSTVNITASDQNRFVTVDITPLVQAWLDGSIANAGIALVPRASDPVRITLDSKETALTSHSPELEVAVVPTEIGDVSSVAAGGGLSGGGTAGDISLSLDTGFTDARYAPLLHGHPVSDIVNAATLGANVFTDSQTIDNGNLDLDASTATSGNITKKGTWFLHNAGTNNLFLGLNAGNLSLAGASNTGVGSSALGAISTGGNNTAVGRSALNFNNTGSENTAVGASALNVNTTGDGNAAVGYLTLFSNTSGRSNTAVGPYALSRNTTGSSNVAVGRGSLVQMTTGNANVAIGLSALELTTGNSNTALGSGAGSAATTGENNIYLGASVLGLAGESNTMYLGGTQTKTMIAGVRGTAVTGAEVVLIDAAGRLGSGAFTVGGNSVGGPEVIDESLTSSDLAPNAVTGSELAAGAVTSDKVAFNYAGSTSPGGAATDVACLGCVAASEVAFSFASLGVNAFAATQTIDNGNLDLDASTATAGNITKNGQPFVHNSGANNTFVGVNAGSLSAAGFGGNTAVGYQALMNQTFGGPNTAVGFAALAANTNGTGNTAVGYWALTSNTTGTENTAAGLRALDSTTDGFMNTAFGSQALRFNVTGDHNTALGRGALSNNLGGFNTAVGSSANAANTSGQRNTAIGQSALFGNTSGSDNVAVGLNAGTNATGSNNIYLGTDVTGVAGESNTMYLGRQGTQTATFIAGVHGTAIPGGEVVVIDSGGRLGSGSVAPAANSVGAAEVIDESLTAADLAPNAVTGSELAADSVTADKVAFSYAAGASEGGAAIDVACVGCIGSTEVSFTFAGSGANTFTGTQTVDGGNFDLDLSTPAGGNLTKNGQPFLHSAGTDNVFLGIQAGNLTTMGSGNAAVGARALRDNTNGANNTAMGMNALFKNTIGQGNTASGTNALANNTTGQSNTALGSFALQANTTGGVNIAIGSSSMTANTSGSRNFAAGLGALQANISGSDNTGTGHAVMARNTNGGRNTANGYQALFNNLTGIGNTAIGADALQNVIGSNNVALGDRAGFNATTGSNNIYLGANVQGVPGESNTMYLGGTQTRSYVAGARGVTTVNPDAIPLMIDSAGQLGTISSSRRFKEDIHDMADASRRILQLRPVTFRYSQSYGNGLKPLQYGLIAEEVAAAFPELAVRGAEGAIETVHYETLNVLLLNELQRMQKDAQQQQRRMEALEQRVDELLALTKAPAAPRR